MPKRLSLVLAAVGALGMALLLLQRANDAKLRALEGEVHRASRASEEATATAERVERVVPALARQVATQPLPVAPAPPTAAAPEPANASTEDPTGVERARRYQAKEAAYLESAYERQGVDAAWAQPARAVLSNAITPQLGTSTLEAIDCRENLCKASFSHPDADSYSGFVDRIAANSRNVWKGAIQIYRDPAAIEGEAGVRNSIYFAREGTDFPRPQP